MFSPNMHLDDKEREIYDSSCLSPVVTVSHTEKLLLIPFGCKDSRMQIN